MADKTPQTYENHRRFVPSYHFVAFGILTLNLVYRAYMTFKAPALGTVVDLLVAIALVLVCLYARVFALAAQDRVIRLEERARLARLLPSGLQERIGELSTGQLVALRFAGDEELPELVQKVLDGGIRDRDQIKRLIRAWRPDHQRV